MMSLGNITCGLTDYRTSKTVFYTKLDAGMDVIWMEYEGLCPNLGKQASILHTLMCSLVALNTSFSRQRETVDLLPAAEVTRVKGAKVGNQECKGYK